MQHPERKKSSTTLLVLSLMFLIVFAFAAAFNPFHSGAATSNSTYVVQPGDYLSLIGKKLGIPWQSIAQANNIQSPYIIYPGEVLIIPQSTGSTTASSTASSISTSSTSSCGYYYSVLPGDYLSKIGSNLGIPWETIAQANNIQSPYILYPNEQLFIPTGGSCSTTTTTTSSSSSSSSSTTSSTTTSSSTSTNSCPPYYYSVQSGDYLSKIGSKLGVSWQGIAQANNLLSPYIIYPNEQLLILGLCGAVTTTSTTTSSTTTTSTTSTSSTSTSSQTTTSSTSSQTTTSSATSSTTTLTSTTTSQSTDTTSLSTTTSSTTSSSLTSSTTSSSTSSQSSPKYVILRFDDGYQSQYVNALPVLQQYNLPASFFAITGHLQNATLPDTVQYTWEYMSWQEMEWLYNNGYEVVDHSATHADMNYLSLSQLQYEVIESRQALIDHGITNLPDYAVPYGDSFGNSTVMSYIYNAGFIHVWSAYPPQQGISNYNQLNTTWYPIDYADNDLSSSQFQAYANLASNSNVVGFEFHRVEANSADVNSSNPYSISLAQFKEDMSWLKSNGFTVILATQLPGYYSGTTSSVTALSSISELISVASFSILGLATLARPLFVVSRRVVKIHNAPTRQSRYSKTLTL